MRFRLTLLFAICGQIGFAQDSTFANRQEYLDYIFGSIPDSLIPTGFLIDRNAELTDSAWSKFLVADEQTSGPHRINDWFRMFQYLSHAKVLPENLIREDSLMWPLYNELSVRVEEPNVVIPLMILDFDINEFSNDALENSYILFQDNQFVPGINPSEGINQHHFFFAGVLADTIQRYDISIELDENYILSNRNKTLLYVTVQCNDQTDTLFIGDIMNLSGSILDDNSLNIKVHYIDETISTNFEFNVRQNKANRAIDEFYFDENGSIGGYPELRYSVFFGCGNADFEKPVFFVSGFGMSSPGNLLSSLAGANNVDLYEKYNLDSLMEELIASGHDIIMVRFVPAVDDIVAGAARLRDLINMVNERKFNNGSYVENIVISYSAGAVASRYCLTRMEHDYMNGVGEHHHCKLYTSFEGEHQGANIPIGPQVMLSYLLENNNSLATSTLYFMANSFQARQLLKYYWPYTQSSTLGQPIVGGQGPDPLRTALMEDMELEFTHPKQFDKFGYYGYPAFTRMVSIVNGSRTTGSFDGVQTINEPFNFDPGHILFEQTNLHKYWLIRLNAHEDLDDDLGAARIVYKYQEENIWGNLEFQLVYSTNSEILMYDYGPGGFLEGGDDMIFKVMNKAAGACIDGCLDGSPDVYQFRTTSFTPVVSCLDIRNFIPSTRQLHWDLQDNLLMFVDYDLVGNLVLSDYYGYPCLGYPSNHFSITPFEAIYVDEFNETHIGSYSTSATNGAYPEHGTLNNQPHSFINDFLFTEIMYKKLYLQNRQIGWNTYGGDYYKAEFETQDEIIIGEEVTPQTDVAPFEVLANGGVICRAGTSISIKTGFHAKAGSQFHAYIQEPTCSYAGGGPSAMALNQGNSAQQSNISATSETADLDERSVGKFSIIPNPNNGNFYIDLGQYNGSVSLEIFDLSGKIKYSGLINSGEPLNLSLEKGVYLTRVMVDNHYLQQKLVIQ